MATHLDGNAVSALPQPIQQELNDWARENWKGRELPELGEDFQVTHYGQELWLVEITREDGRLRYGFWSEDPEKPPCALYTQVVPEEHSLPEHLAQHFVLDLTTGPVDVGDAYTTGVLPDQPALF